MNYTFQSISHFRELGGYKTRDGKTVKKDLLIRSGDLTHVNEEEQKLLNSLNIDTVFDLRSKKRTNFK